MKRATVHDIAQAANASLATVDRVLNGRPGVSPAMVNRVREAVEKLSYRRDAFAVSLATNRQDRFVFLLPPSTTSTFFANIHSAVAQQAARLAPERVMISCCVYAPFSETELAGALDRLCTEDCAGVAVVAVEGPRVREAINRLTERGTHVVTLVADSLGARRLQYVGIDNTAAGRTAGSLLGRFIARPEATVAVVLGSLTVRDHVERHLGFCQAMARDFPDLRVLSPLLGRDDRAVTEELVEDLLRREPRLAGIYSVGGGNRGVIQALESNGREREIIVVAHELTAPSRAALLRGTYDAVLHQDPSDEVDRVIRILRGAADEHPCLPGSVPVHIFLRDNLP